MIILGIDPGTRITGYGVVELKESGKLQPIDFGCIRPPTDMALQERYHILFNSIEALLGRFIPQAIAVESQFVLKNAQSALKLGMAKGMVLLAAARKGILVSEFAPKKAKLAVAGSGQASKWQVQKMVQSLLHLPTLPEPEDAADALALAICYAHYQRIGLCMNLSGVNLLKKSPSKQSWKRKGSAIGLPSP